MSEPALGRTRAELSGLLADGEDHTAVVMTLGALHSGHRALMTTARELVGPDGQVVVTIFVNPLQFGVGEDFEHYPRPIEADLAVCAAEGVDVVFAPERAEMYPGGDPVVTLDAGDLGAQLEGAARPTHFAGVLTVVAKLLNLVVPRFAVFGEKDYQQLTLIRRMVADLELPYEIVAVPTVREADGLALSSRNRYLSPEERTRALALSRALDAGSDAAEASAGGTSGPAAAEAVLAAARKVLAEAGVEADYLELRGTDLAEGVTAGEARLLVAARIGTTRLIDNVAVHLPG